MTDLIADRFVSQASGVLDLATGTPVQLLVTSAGTASHQAAWSDRCGALARLRHPLLNPLIDYGAADRHHLFEAYGVSPPLRAPAARALAGLRHVTRFLESQAMPLEAERARRAVRLVARGPDSPEDALHRPVGVTLQRRLVLDAIGDTLRDAAPGGVTSISLYGDPGSGLRTIRLLLARAARLEGFVPVAAQALAQHPSLIDLLLTRHVALLVEGDAPRHLREIVATVAARLGAASNRRHLLITFGRGGQPGPHTLQVDRMGGTAMQAMVYRDRQDGPSEADLTASILAADGRPGALLDHLRTGTLTRTRPAVSFVHETSPHYAVPSVLPNPTPRRGSAALERAPARAERLAAGGRHAAAARLTERALRVRLGRGEPQEAARCALTLGWLLRQRGDHHEALRHFEHARSLAAEGPLSLRATIAIAVVSTDEDRPADAEALLRSARSAAALLGDRHDEQAATRALARSVLWQGRADEAAALLAPGRADDRGVAAWALIARVEIALGAVERALVAASRAIERAEATAAPGDIALAARAMTMARAAAGDVQGAGLAASQGLAAAAAAHLPLAALRIRIAWLGAYRGRDQTDVAIRLRADLAAALTRPLPPLLQRQIATVCGGGTAEGDRATASRESPLADLRHLLETTQTAPDDQGALQALADALLLRVRACAVAIVVSPDMRVVIRAGRPWGADPTIAVQAMAAGIVVRGPAAPPECAAPIRYGGDVIGALACRWSAGVVVDLERATADCSVAALAAAASLRGLADRTPSVPPDATWENLLGTSPSANDLRRAILSAARAPFPVLILGESGSGKELVARAIHRLGTRRARRLCTINCAAISDELVEAELFGHTRGAFTGAMTERAGLFEEADGGTLFLDEVGELSARAQAKLLRALQDGEVRRVGDNLPRRVDTRVVAATNRCLEQEVTAGRFRADLRFRLDVIRIAVPPLRDRPTDIPALVAHFWEDAAARVGSHATLAPETVAALTRYDWPGNVRELQNAVASLAVHGPRRGRITPGTLPLQVARAAASEPATFEAAREEFERRYVRTALARAGGQRARAARSLGMSRQGLAKMLRRLGIDAADEPVSA